MCVESGGRKECLPATSFSNEQESRDELSDVTWGSRLETGTESSPDPPVFLSRCVTSGQRDHFVPVGGREKCWLLMTPLLKDAVAEELTFYIC